MLKGKIEGGDEVMLRLDVTRVDEDGVTVQFGNMETTLRVAKGKSATGVRLTSLACSKLEPTP